MAYRDVFRFLQEAFPQVDIRIVKAAAIEHPKDADAAAEFILSEILPSSSGPGEASYTLDVTEEAHCLPREVGMQKVDILSQRKRANDENVSVLAGSVVASRSEIKMASMEGEEASVTADHSLSLSHHQEAELSSFPSDMISMDGEVVVAADHKNACSLKCNSNLINESVTDLTFDERTNDHQVSNEKSKEDVTSEKQISPSQGYCSSTLCVNIQELHDIETSGSVTTVSSDGQCFPLIHGRILDLEESASETDINYFVEYEVPLSRRSKRSANKQDFFGSEVCNPASTATTSAKDISLSIVEGIPHVLEGACSDKSSNSSLINAGGQLSRVPSRNTCEEATFKEVNDVPLASDKSTMVATTQSGHVISIDLLEDFVTAAKSNKKTLVSALGLTTNMMREVEHLEDKAKQAKEEASKAGQDILTKAEEIREMVKQTIQANDMRAEEVYGEKAILATEARELQSWLLNLSNERDKYLLIIEEIRQTLEARLAVAQKELEEAEQEKLGKVEKAHNILKEQEVIMEEVVLESKRLQEAAEENSKLRDFLTERGRAVDILQGEIAVICEDVLLLKEKVDGRMPLNRLLQSSVRSLTSSSISSSHSRSMSRADLEESQERASGELSQNSQQESFAHGDQLGDTNKGLTDDDWEFLIHFSPSS